MLHQDTRAILRSLALVIVTVSHFTLSSSNTMFANIPSRGQFAGKIEQNNTGSKLQPAFPIPYKNSKMLWYPTDRGYFVPAFLEGGPAVMAVVESDVRFLLSNMENQNSPTQVYSGDRNSLNDARYIPNADVVFLCHGFGSSADQGPNPGIKRELFRGDYKGNIISIDWSKPAAGPWYNSAAANCKDVGKFVCQLINFLVAEGLVNLNQIWIVGHSLGAHVGGYAGSCVSSAGTGKIGRIMALDPALPLFGDKTDDDRIDPTDAAFVDVIHTAAGTLLDGGLAFTDPRGHVDFYPNSGSHQPGCGADLFGTCSHSRCYEYVAESITNTNAFMACKCNSWDEFNSENCPCLEFTYMGWHVPPTTTGSYYLKTNGEAPWSLS